MFWLIGQGDTNHPPNYAETRASHGLFAMSTPSNSDVDCRRRREGGRRLRHRCSGSILSPVTWIKPYVMPSRGAPPRKIKKRITKELTQHTRG